MCLTVSSVWGSQGIFKDSPTGFRGSWSSRYNSKAGPVAHVSGPYFPVGREASRRPYESEPGWIGQVGTMRCHHDKDGGGCFVTTSSAEGCLTSLSHVAVGVGVSALEVGASGMSIRTYNSSKIRGDGLHKNG